MNEFLQGNFAPWRHEENINELTVIGKIPDDLNGVLLRNGPNPQFDPIGDYHWFGGDGMLHAIRIQNGKASYDNRWVRTERFLCEQKAGKALSDGIYHNIEELKKVSSNTANTNIIAYQDKLLALNEGALPTQIELRDLSTLGNYTFDNQITRRLTAHPRFDYQRKEFITYSYIHDDESLMYYRLNQDNKLIAMKAINWPYPAMLHDFVTTENYVIFPIFPCTMSVERMFQGKHMMMWEGDQLNTFFIITDREGNEICSIETDPCYVYHFGNAYEENHCIIIDAMVGKCSALMPDRHGKIATRNDSISRLARWKINLETRAISLTYLDELAAEFPRFDERFNGRPYQHLYTGGRADQNDQFDRIMHYDLVNQRKNEHCFNNDVPSEPVFVPRSEKEGDGYVLTIVYRADEDRSDIVILDAMHIEESPVAIIKIPHRIPYGFHGNFINYDESYIEG